MNSIVQHIEYLISVNDCVVIPQWGALIASYESARFDDDAIIPPSRHISFNSQVNHNDGLLAHSLMRRNGITYERAMNLLGAGVVKMKRQLKAFGAIPIGGVGLFKQGEAGVEFIPFGSGVAGEYYGLSNFKLKRIDLPEQNDTDNAATVIKFEPRRAMAKKAIRVAASIAAILALGFMLSTPIVDRNVQQAGLNLPEVKQAVNSTIPAEKAEVSTQACPVVKKAEECRYQLVVATFDTEKTASEFIAMHSDFGKIETVKVGKRYRLVAAYSDSRDEILQAQASLPANCQSWIAEKK